MEGGVGAGTSKTRRTPPPHLSNTAVFSDSGLAAQCLRRGPLRWSPLQRSRPVALGAGCLAGQHERAAVLGGGRAPPARQTRPQPPRGTLGRVRIDSSGWSLHAARFVVKRKDAVTMCRAGRVGLKSPAIQRVAREAESCRAMPSPAVGAKSRLELGGRPVAPGGGFNRPATSRRVTGEGSRATGGPLLLWGPRADS